MSKIIYFTKQSWLLIVASFVFGLIIAVTNSALSQRIESDQTKKLFDLMGQLISGSERFSREYENVTVKTAAGKEIKTDIYKAVDSESKTTGYAFIAEGSGFADKIKLVIALDAKAEKFLGFKVLSSNETPGFGSKISEAYFSNQFIGAPAAILELTKIGSPEKIDNQIVAISGATVSSQAVADIFNTYIDTVRDKLTKGRDK